ncbi:MAG: hydroxymyristoyl-ACP dehydratase [Rubrivivax sp.]|nr:hydroxymyristoyl-ACP dehydratase [Rubrivivax sp.]
MKLDRAGIASRLPHAGTMCLLDSVQRWDAEHIVCSAEAPTPAHPLARDGVVPTIVAVEYAAQASAVHGALLEAEAGVRAGLLARLSEVDLHGAEVPSALGPLAVTATLIGRHAAGCLYAFRVECGAQAVASGRLTVAFVPGAVP